MCGTPEGPGPIKPQLCMKQRISSYWRQAILLLERFFCFGFAEGHCEFFEGDAFVTRHCGALCGHRALASGGCAQGGFQINPGWFFQGDQPFGLAAFCDGMRFIKPRDPL